MRLPDLKFRKLSIQSLLLLLLAAVALPAAGGFAWLISHQRERARDAAYAQVRVAANNIATQIDSLMSNSEATLERLASRPSVQALDPRQCDPVFQEQLLLRRESTVFGLRDLEGRLICTSGSNVRPLLKAEAAETAWFREGVANNRFTASNAYLGPASGRWVSILTYPVRDDAGRVTGLLFMGIDLLKLQERLAQNIQRNAHLAVFDREYKFLLRSVEPEKWLGKPLPAAQLAHIKGRDEAYFPAQNILGVSQLWSLIRMRDTGWSISVGLPEDEVFASSGSDMRRSVEIGVGVMLLMLVLTWFISRPIRKLARTSARLIAGEASVRAEVEGPAEIEAVAAHFNRLLDERERTLETLHKSEERFVLATRGSSDGFWDWNIVSGENYLSDRFCELLGYSREELRPHVDTWHELLHPDDLAQTMRALDDHRQRHKPYDAEFRMRTKAGEYRWFRGRGQAVWNEAGQAVRMAGSIIDIDERKRAEERLRVSEARLREAQRLAKLGSWELDLTRGSLHWSDEIFRMFEIDQKKFGATYEAFLEAIHPDDRAAVDRAYGDSLEKRQPYEITHRLRMADGRIKHVQERCWSEFDAAGKALRSVGTVQDITERWVVEERLRASLREKETLLREIHHRVKNNLQIISSLLHFQSRKVKDPEDLAVFQEGRDRLKSMILVHEKLYQSQDLSRIEFGDYARALLEEVSASHRDSASGVALKVEAGAVYLPVEVALPLGMLLSELATNAFKYAFPAGSGGELRVTIEDAEGQLRLGVADNGVGLPASVDPQAPESFGMQLVANLVEQLAGEVRYERGQGLQIEITVPLAAEDRADEGRAA